MRRFLTGIIILFITVFGFSATAFASPSIAGVTLSNVAESTDYATNVLGDPWDMSNHEDMSQIIKHFKGKSMSRGIWRGTTTSRDGYFWFLWGGYPGSYAAKHDGAAHPINTDYYKRLSFRMYLGVSDTSYKRGIFYWFYDTKLKKKKAILFKVYPRWHTYQIDIPWSGRPISLRLNPINRANTRVKIDWIRLTNKPGARASLYWNDTVSGNASIYMDDNNGGYDGSFFAKASSSVGVNLLNLDLDGIAPSTHYFYIVGANGASSNYSSAVHINDAPFVKIINPDEVGGRDWARVALRNSWDMRSHRDIAKTYNVARARFKRGIFSAINAKKSQHGARKHDPYIILNLGRKTINTRKFHRLTFRYRYSRGFSLRRGTMTRIGWTTKRYNDPKYWQISDDIITYTGWNKITIDLKKIRLNRGHYGWRNRVTRLRFDPHEDRRTRKFYIDYITLREDDTARGGKFRIKYALTDADSRNVNVQIYRDRDRRFGNGNEVLIGEQTVSSGRHSYLWKTGRVKGANWIYIKANDGINESGFYSSGPLRS